MRNLNNAEDLAMLPQWAQRQITTMQANILYLEGRLREGPEDSDTFAEPYFAEHMTPLGRGTIVRFGGTDYHGTFDCRYRDGELIVSATDAVDIRPTASNTFRVRISR